MKNKKCQLCKRKTEVISHWINAHFGYRNLEICEECDLSVREQIFLLMQDKVDEEKK